MTSPTLDYYFTPLSPWTYLGHARLVAMARAAGAPVRLWPVDLGNGIFPVSGGLPLAKRAPQRQAYRLIELERYARFTGQRLNAQPKFFPVSPDDAARLIIAVDEADGSEVALTLAGAMMRGTWVEERNLADSGVLATILAECGLRAARLAESQTAEVDEHYRANTRHAVDAGIFGAPSYVVDGELFWGQDRLDFVERKLAKR